MRILPWSSFAIAIAILLAWATLAEARLFWQHYGATIPTANGGCTWNWNQDFFVPRYPTSGRYGLYSPCKSSHSISAACRTAHPFYPGYCGIYGPWHYHRRDHVYRRNCGCTPLQISGVCGHASRSCGVMRGSSYLGCQVPMSHFDAALPNVESSNFDILGSIPVEGSELLTRTDFSQLGGAGGQLLLQPNTALPQLPGVPSLNLPQPSQPLLPSR